jgi:hypothetical protein
MVPAMSCRHFNRPELMERWWWFSFDLLTFITSLAALRRCHFVGGSTERRNDAAIENGRPSTKKAY